MTNLLNHYTATAICKKEYVFNKTESFSGVIFNSGKEYKLDIKGLKNKHNNLIGLYNDNSNAYVGMDIERFKEYFIINESKLEIEDLIILKDRGLL